MIKLTTLLEKRDFLQKLSNLSFEYNVVNRKYPLTQIYENQYDEINKIYDKILNDVINLANTIQKYYGQSRQSNTE